ncbi:MAG: hypothetical protein KA010_00460 [Saprospiraceae bacterium]|nr:hypothetical protein [Saprospiraceae bacterium]
MQQEAINLIRNAICPYGIVASLEPQDNYQRIWARDSVIAGLAGLWAGDDKISDALITSLRTLVSGQSEVGQIPSNITPSTLNVSYGGLVGRTDATLWWLIGFAEYSKIHPSAELIQSFESNVTLAFNLLKAWEYNDRGLIYSPLGGNWADEYVTQGYTLYDNCLYLWALEAISTIYPNKHYQHSAERLRQLIKTNYFLDTDFDESIAYYHPPARKKFTKKLPYPAASLAPNGYDTRFDMAGCALALYLDLGSAKQNLQFRFWLENKAQQQQNYLLPVFYPIIYPYDKDWNLLNNNYSYRFKNEPYHFHNGGCWFVWLGFLALALKKSNFLQLSAAIRNQINASLENEKPHAYSFYEYRSTDTFEAGGVKNLCFSAAGAIFSNLKF